MREQRKNKDRTKNKRKKIRTLKGYGDEVRFRSIRQYLVF